MNKAEIVSYFKLSASQTNNIDFFISSIIEYNNHTNLIGKSTISDIWNRHVLDCLQLSKYIDNKKSKILDLGTGAGLPGILLSIIGYKNVKMIDSIKKKTDFVKIIINDLKLPAIVQNTRIEKAKTSYPDVIVSRALAPLSQLLTYALLHSNKNTTLLFLKGRNVNNEIENAMKNFIFKSKKIKSVSSSEGYILQINNLRRIND